MTTPNTPLWEVFIRSRNGLAHKHCGSLHASDATMALQAARDIYTRRGEGLSIWVVPSNAITASDPSEKGTMYIRETIRILDALDLTKEQRNAVYYGNLERITGKKFVK